jgi:hypothetical protein
MWAEAGFGTCPRAPRLGDKSVDKLVDEAVDNPVGKAAFIAPVLGAVVSARPRSEVRDAPRHCGSSMCFT